MGLGRRQFTKEFKLAAVRRLEQGVSMGEAARALEVSPNVLHRWRREFRQGPGTPFPATANSAGRKAGSRNWRGRSPTGSGDRFFEGVLAVHRGAVDAAGTDWKSAVYRKVQEEVEWPSYGRPRITEELRRQGWTVNPKRVRRLLREDNYSASGSESSW
jgi:hypothetical protein